jgi:hypothetical protein
MIYRHYKGGLYFSIGFATRFSKNSHFKSINQVAMARYTEAKTSEEEKEIAVLLVNDESTGCMYYAYDSNVINGEFIFYKDLKGNYWLRPYKMFFGKTEDGRFRFNKMSERELFDIIANLVGENNAI